MLIETRKGRLLLVALFMITVFTVTCIYELNTRVEVRWESHVVERGETMWEIAGKSDIKKDTRDVVAFMSDYNRISNASSIKAGDIIMYPVAK